MTYCLMKYPLFRSVPTTVARLELCHSLLVVGFLCCTKLASVPLLASFPVIQLNHTLVPLKQFSFGGGTYCCFVCLFVCFDLLAMKKPYSPRLERV